MRELPQHLKGRDFVRIGGGGGGDLASIIDLADDLKRARRSGEEEALLPGRALGLLFLKPSTRTRVSFAVAIAQLGGAAVPLSSAELHLGQGTETVRDTATVLSRYLDALVVRTFDQADVEELARHADIPVINGLTNWSHPCQALADLMTMRERLGRLSGVRVAYLGDGQNVCSPPMVAGAKFGMRFTAATPKGYEPPEQVLIAARRAAVQAGGTVELVPDPVPAVRGADVLYTDVWTSMGQEAEHEKRLSDFEAFRIDAELLDRAKPEAIVLHCLPPHYGEEITEDVLHGPQSAAWDEAENRLHTQKALLALLVR